MDLLRRSEILRWHLITIFALSSTLFQLLNQALFKRFFHDTAEMVLESSNAVMIVAIEISMSKAAVDPSPFCPDTLWIHRLGSLPEALTHRRGNNAQKKVEIIYSWYISFGYALQLYLFPCFSRNFASCRLKFNTYVRKLCIICWRGHTEDLAKHCLRGKVAY